MVTTRPERKVRTKGAYTYLVYTTGGVTYAEDWEGNIVYTNATPLTVLQWAHDNLPATGGLIFIKAPFYADGQLSITKTHVSIVTDDYPPTCVASWETDEHVWIRQIFLDATSNNLDGIHITGVITREVHIYANGHSITYCIFEHCTVLRDGTYNGVYFEGDGTVNGWMDDIVFKHDQFYNSAGGDGTTRGNINFEKTVMMTEIRFESCEFDHGAAENTFFHVQDDASIDGIHIINPRFTRGGDTGSLYIFYFEVATIARIVNLNLIGGRAEIHNNYKIFYIPHSAGYPTRFNVLMENVRWQINSGKTCTVLDCPNGNWGAGDYYVFKIQGCSFKGIGTCSLGTNQIQSSYHDIIVKDNIGLNPIGLGVNPFIDTSVQRTGIMPLGAAASPNASTDYKVQYSDIFITSTDSGDTNCSINIEDPDGNTLVVGASTLTLQYVPRGYIINWGAFTGTDPTVVVYFA